MDVQTSGSGSGARRAGSAGRWGGDPGPSVPVGLDTPSLSEPVSCVDGRCGSGLVSVLLGCRGTLG